MPDNDSGASGAVAEVIPAEALEKLQKLLSDAETTEALVRQDGDNKWYTYPVDGREFISVTSCLGATWSKPWLAAWAAKLAAQYAAENLAALLMLDKDGQGRAAVVGAIKGEAARLRDLKRDAGKHAHKVIEALALWAAAEGGAEIALPLLPDELANADMDGVTLVEFVDACLTGFCNFISDFDVEIEMSEAAVFHPDMEYAGTADMIVTLARHLVPDAPGTWPGDRDRVPGGDDRTAAERAVPMRPMRLLVDAKTGQNLEATMAAQMAAYRRAPEVLVDNMGTLVPMPAVDGTAILHLRPEFPRGYRLRTLSPGEDARGWTNFRQALNLYHGYAAARGVVGTVMSPLGIDGKPLPMLLGDLEGYGAGISALIKHTTATTIADVARMTREQALAVKGVGPKTVEGIERALADNNLSFAAAEAVA